MGSLQGLGKKTTREGWNNVMCFRVMKGSEDSGDLRRYRSQLEQAPSDQMWDNSSIVID